MRPILTALALTAALSTSAFAQNKMDNDDISAMKQLAQADLSEIAAGKTAAEKAQSPDVKKFGQKMVDDHTKMLADLRALAKKKSVALPQDADVKDMAQMKLMERKSGAEETGNGNTGVANQDGRGAFLPQVRPVHFHANGKHKKANTHLAQEAQGVERCRGEDKLKCIGREPPKKRRSEQDTGHHFSHHRWLSTAGK